MDFTTSLNGALNVQYDVLVDILAWQMVIVKKMAEIEARSTGRQEYEVKEEWQALKTEARSQIMDSVYAQHGPDLSKDMGLDEQ